MESKCGGEEGEQEFRLGEIVWAKIIGYPWWPARVTQLPTTRNPAFRVDFFYDNSQYIGPNSVPFSPHRKYSGTRTCVAILICIDICPRGYVGRSPRPIDYSKNRLAQEMSPSCRRPQLKSLFTTKNNYRNHHSLTPSYKRITRYTQLHSKMKNPTTAANRITYTQKNNSRPLQHQSTLDSRPNNICRLC